MASCEKKVMQCYTLMFLLCIICSSPDRRSECSQTLPTLCWLPVFSRAKDNTIIALYSQFEKLKRTYKTLLHFRLHMRTKYSTRRKWRSHNTTRILTLPSVRDRTASHPSCVLQDSACAIVKITSAVYVRFNFSKWVRYSSGNTQDETMLTAVFCKWQQWSIAKDTCQNRDNGCGNTTLLQTIVTMQNNCNNFSNCNTDTGHVL